MECDSLHSLTPTQILHVFTLYRHHTHFLRPYSSANTNNYRAIVLSALSPEVDGATATDHDGFFVKPIRSTTTTGLQYLRYNPTSGEIMRTSTTSRRLSYVDDETVVIEDMDAADSARVWDLRPVTSRSEQQTEGRADAVYGLVADEVAKIDPRLVHWGEDDQGRPFVECVDYEQVLPLLLHQTRALKESHEALEEAYETRIQALEKKLEALLR